MRKPMQKSLEIGPWFYALSNAECQSVSNASRMILFSSQVVANSEAKARRMAEFDCMVGEL